MTDNNMIYVVYPYAEGRYNAVKVNEKNGTISIHRAIAAFENDESRSRRHWKSPIEAGSFNITKIAQADSAADAIQQAKEQGLKYEPKPVVLNRYRSEVSKAREAFENIGRSGGASPRRDTRASTFDDLFKGDSSAFNDIFKDIMGKGPKR